MGFKNWYSKN